MFLIVDECHHCGSEQNRLIFEFLPYMELCKGKFFTLGLTATLPYGEERDYLISDIKEKVWYVWHQPDVIVPVN